MISLQEANIRDTFNGSKCLICATGPSIEKIDINKIDCLTIGINDIGKLFYPDFLVVSDVLPISEDGRHFHKVKRMLDTGSRLAFTYSKENVFNKSDMIYYSISPIKTVELEKSFDHHILPASVTTTEIGISLAIYLGFSYIGIIGFDMIGHDNETQVDYINEDLDKLNDYAIDHGNQIFNLSKSSLIVSFDYMKFNDFLKL